MESETSIRQDMVAPMNEIGGPIDNARGNNPERKRGRLWVLVTPALAVFLIALSRQEALC